MITLTLVSLSVILSSTAVNEFANSLMLAFRLDQFDITHVLVIVIVFCFSDWGPLPSVVVLESKYGFKGLRKSKWQSVMVRVY